MKKVIFILLALSLCASCENEPLDPDLTEQGGGGDDGGNTGTESSDLTLSIYELDAKINLVFFGIPIETINNSNIIISNNKIVASTNALSANESSFEIENQTITRNSSGQIVRDVSVNSDGITTNETLVTYTDGVITQISYDYFIDEDEEDYIYNFTYDGSSVLRTEVGSNISTVFTLDGFNRIITKESFDGTFSIQAESVTYAGNGNIISSNTTGEVENNNRYLFDENTNPLKEVFEDNYLLTFLNADYSDEIGSQIAQFLSTNNWNGAIINGETFAFDLNYNTVGRIISREIAYNFGPEFNLKLNEKFNYVN
ncbi:MAG: hypothetical protein NWP87_03885 [Winogradskyella sp.]|nr:hypothetical protein [Winogradskyella sp.]